MFLAIGISKEVVKISVLCCAMLWGIFLSEKSIVKRVPKIVRKVPKRRNQFDKIISFISAVMNSIQLKII